MHAVLEVEEDDLLRGAGHPEDQNGGGEGAPEARRSDQKVR